MKMCGFLSLQTEQARIDYSKTIIFEFFEKKRKEKKAPKCVFLMIYAHVDFLMERYCSPEVMRMNCQCTNPWKHKLALIL